VRRAPWMPPPTLREIVGRLVGRYAMGLAAIANMLRSEPTRWCKCTVHGPWLIVNANGPEAWCPECKGRLR
jgi:hypothetical protein